ncbi:MAG: glycosyltransferase family 2 protein [Candidatus Bathyarchaeota archaeon]|nr:glycosyltransferase family 2 protein [Candidatus Bathyarchaeota archaeon]
MRSIAQCLRDEFMESVDVVLLTLNSDRMLEPCVESIYRNVPVNQLIVVDGFSTDNTLSILKKFQRKHHNIKIVFDKGTRATSRQKGIENVSSEWFLFVDSDVVLCKDWYKKASRCMGSDVGAVWGIEVWSTIKKPSALKMFLWVTMKIFELRGGTHDTLIRTRAVRDIRIPAGLHVFEDAYIKDWITSKGYRVVACYDPYCVHYRPKTVWTFRGSLGLIADAVRCGSVKLLVKLVFAYGFYTAYSISQMLSRPSNTKT